MRERRKMGAPLCPPGHAPRSEFLGWGEGDKGCRGARGRKEEGEPPFLGSPPLVAADDAH